MTLSFKILGYEIARLELDTVPETPTPTTTFDRAIKKTSRVWMRGLLR